MSLLGNRGRFTQDENKMFNNHDSEYTSVISLIGKNPTKLFNIKQENVNNDNDVRKKLLSINNKPKKEAPVYSTHQEHNERLSKLNQELKDENINKNEFNRYSKKTNVKLIVAMFIIEVLTLFGIFFAGSFYRISKEIQDPIFRPEKVKPTLPPQTINAMKGYKTVAVFGVDSRTGSVDKGNNADVNMIVNLNFETGDIQLISVYRDLYLSISDNNHYDKLNAAYRNGGPEQAVKALNKNLDLYIDSYFSFNWKAVADGIELLGGIDLEITKSEFAFLNAFIHETCIATGIDAKNPAAHYVKSAGMQHLDGVQAVAYGRLRLMDSDFQRVERQKKVIALSLEKAKTLDIPRLRLIVEAVLPQIAYAFDFKDILSLISIIKTVNISESTGCPDINNVVSMNMGGSGDCVVPLNLEKAVIKLHKTLFNVDDYKPTDSVKRYSNRITELRAKYTEENRINASVKESSIIESVIESSKDETKTTRRNSSVSSSSSVKQTVPIEVEAPNDLPIVDADRKVETEALVIDDNNNLPTETTINNIEPNFRISDLPGVVLDGPPGANKPEDNSVIPIIGAPY